MNIHVTFVCVMSLSFCSAQDYHREHIDLSRLADDVFGSQELDLNYDELYENLAQLLINPLDLNRATADELRFLVILNEEQIQNFLSYRNENGVFLSLYELQAVPAYDPETIYKLVPFVRVSDQSSSLKNIFHRLIHEENNYLLARYERTLENKKGFDAENDPDNKFKGSRDKLYLRFRTSRPHDFSIGFTTEKDAGEQIRWSPSAKQYGFDYWSAHVQVQNKGPVKNLIIGDFQSQFGQGLILGGAFGMGKGAETVIAVRRGNLGFLPYTSANEGTFLRGIASTIQANKNLFISAFFSTLNQDAAFSADSLGSISSFQTTGLHRSKKELETRKKINERNMGLIINFKRKHFEGGLLYHRTEFSDPVKKNSSPYNQVAFRGYQNQNIGGFFNFNVQNFTFFSEAAKTIYGGWGVVAGTIGSLGVNLDLAMAYRNYKSDFHSFNSNAFAEGSSQNESGVYWGLKYRFTRRLTMAANLDLFKFPWLRFGSYAPSHGHEWLLRFNYQPSRHVLIFAQIREETKVKNTPGKEPRLYSTMPGTKRNYWLNADYRAGEKLRLKTRAQFSTFELGDRITNGFTLLQDISVNVGKFEFTARYALFDTEDFDNRQYVYENDVWLAYSLQAYSGAGVRNYLMVEYKVSKKITFWLRYSYSRFDNQEEIGSGLETIQGNTRNDVKFQVRLKF